MERRKSKTTVILCRGYGGRDALTSVAIVMGERERGEGWWAA